MAKRMLIDATHPEETRVVVHNGSRLEEFDYETVSKRQLKGNIYLAKITRVEPSLQAAFVEYGGNRHGFLPFSEIHPDYYRIPIADREALLAEEQALKSSARVDDDDADEAKGDLQENADDDSDTAEIEDERTLDAGAETAEEAASETAETEDSEAEASATEAVAEVQDGDADAEGSENDTADVEQDDTVEEIEGESSVDTLSEDDDDDVVQRSRAKLLRKYKIQEVIKRRQVILVQVSKEERGNKGAALTTYLSLAGRYCVLMPNTNKGGGISRKISNAGDRRRLKEILSELKIPEGIAVIVRTAGSQRNKTEIRRDYEYLMRLWNEIRELTLRSSAPALIHEEANLIKRAIRDLYSRDMEDVLVEGEGSYKAAKSFMRTLMPSHAKKVQLYKDPAIPLFHRYKVEGQLDAIHNPTVQLKSGGYIVINPTEALVAVDVNSGKATRERHIEETALKTNLEAADEVARQVRLRDLAGLVVIDFIDMEESRHNREVERRLKEAMKNDRARIQLGRISPFGLLEMSRQRLRPSLVENSTQICPTCQGVGTVRTTESTALHVLRAVEGEGIRRAGGNLMIKVPTAVALYMLNQKRALLFNIEERYGFSIEIAADDSLTAPDHMIERVGEPGERASDHRAERTSERSSERSRDRGRDRQSSRARDDEDLQSETFDSQDEAGSEKKRSRRRRRRKRDDETATSPAEETPAIEAEEADAAAVEEVSRDESGDGDDEEGKSRKRRRRGKRGGRRRSRRKDSDDAETLEGETPESEAPSEDTAGPEDAIAAAPASADDTSTGQTDDEAAADESATVEAVASETETTEAAPPAAAAPEAAASAAADAEASDGQADSLEEAAPPLEEAPKPKRRRSRAKKSSDSDQSTADKSSEEKSPSADETAEAESKAEKTPKKRATRSRASAAKTPRSRARKPATAKATADAATQDAVAPEAEATEPQVAESRPSEPAELVAQEVAVPEPAMAESAVAEPVQDKPDANSGEERQNGEEGEKRRGWWSRWV